MSNLCDEETNKHARRTKRRSSGLFRDRKHRVLFFYTHAVLQSGEHLIAIGLLCTVVGIKDTAPGPESA